MVKAVKNHGRVYTPLSIVNCILDFSGYNSCENVIEHHVIDNSCGDGAFLCEILKRYCHYFLQRSNDYNLLKMQLQKYIHGIELDDVEAEKCRQNLSEIARTFDVNDVQWDIICADTLSVHKYDNKMDYVFGNPPYVRVHNLDESYASVKQYSFAEKGMTDLFIVFFEIGFKMLSSQGILCLITPSSWLSSKAGQVLRKYIQKNKNLSGVIDLGHYQPFEATTYTLISRFDNLIQHSSFEYYTYSSNTDTPNFICNLNLWDSLIGQDFYLADTSNLKDLKNIKESFLCDYVKVKNGFATLADDVFIGQFPFTSGTINVLKASTGEWKKCIFPYTEKGEPVTEQQIANNTELYQYLVEHKEKLNNGRDIERNGTWFLFGRTQAIRDVYKTKYAINTIIKDIDSIKLEKVGAGEGVYSGLYILTELSYEDLKSEILSDEFLSYVKLLKHYKSGGYYTYSSSDLQQYLNYKFKIKYG